MPFKNREDKRAYQRKWIAKRRRDWLKEHGPCVDCGSTRYLEVDHEDPLQKCSHRIWSYSKEKREHELAKCVVRCRSCHKKKTRDEGSYGRRTPYQRYVPSNLSAAYAQAQENECLNQILSQPAVESALALH